LDWKSSIDALLERALAEDKTADDTTSNLTTDSGPGKAPLLFLATARAALDALPPE
jgi:hypothetical protein